MALEITRSKRRIAQRRSGRSIGGQLDREGLARQVNWRESTKGLKSKGVDANDLFPLHLNAAKRKTQKPIGIDQRGDKVGIKQLKA